MTKLKNYLKPLTDKNAKLVTNAKIKRADSGNLKGIATNNVPAPRSLPTSGLTFLRALHFTPPKIKFKHCQINL